MPADEPASFEPERFIAVLDAHAVELVIVGRFGAQTHGVRRQTFDLDVEPRNTDENLSRLAATLRELEARPRVGGMSDEEARQLPLSVDGDTLRSFGSPSRTTDVGPVDVR